MIKLQVIGNLGKDAIVNNVNGKNVINFNVAHTERYRDAQGNQKDRTTWVECAYWTERTGIAPYLKKGTQVYLEGTPDVRTYTTQDGRNGASLTVRILNIQLLGSRTGGENTGGGYNAGSGGYSNNNNNYSSGSSNSYAAAPAPAATDITEPLDDLPF